MSPRKPSPKFRNRILAALQAADRKALHPHLEPVALERSKHLETANKAIENVYFPERGIASVVGTGKAKREVEIGIIGCEGMTGVAVILGDHRSPHQTFVQVPGDGHRLSSATLRKAMTNSATLQSLLLKYVQAFMLQGTNTAVANARGTVYERLARWVLMAQDRTDGDGIPLTHEFLSIMLAVRRPGVTEAVHELARKGLITHNRGIIKVSDREGLIECANGFYGTPESEYARLLG